MSNLDYNLLASLLSKRQVQIDDGEVLIHTYNIKGKIERKYFADENEYISLSIYDSNFKLRIKLQLLYLASARTIYI
jgi:putative ABC transport system permease protein